MSLAACIESYILAKDGNRPHLLAHAFEQDATVTLDVQTDQITFPGQLAGREAIAQALVTRFAGEFENVYTFCLADPPAPDRRTFGCPWLVAMTSRQDRKVRVGWGRYDWTQAATHQKLSSLAITIMQMETLPSGASAPVLDWVSQLPYPWCSLDQLWSQAPELDALASWPLQMSA